MFNARLCLAAAAPHGLSVSSSSVNLKQLELEHAPWWLPVELHS